ncbi:MAG: RluA family pseudouridine synthase [Lactobacillaceae bacterium]|nr:RluA family pseudouridine synthase [Lactobacillaceae bacterium]
MTVETFVVGEIVGRLDKVIAETLPDYSRSQVQDWIEAGLVTVNGIPKKSKYKAKTGETIQFEIPAVVELDIQPQDIPLNIVYEDDDLLVINKPQGMVVHPSLGHEDGTLVNALMFHTPLSQINGAFRPGIVHRIDKDTSGLLMVAKNDKAHEALSAQLKEKKNLREYYALVHGEFTENSGTINAPIGRSNADRKKNAVIKGGRDAVTHFRVIKRFVGYTLLAVKLETGRTHQIRVHMAYINHPVAGDPLYGPKKTLPGQGQYLHAASLGLTQPTTGEEMVFEAPLPDNFVAMLDQLEPYAEPNK